MTPGAEEAVTQIFAAVAIGYASSLSFGALLLLIGQSKGGE